MTEYKVNNGHAGTSEIASEIVLLNHMIHSTRLNARYKSNFSQNLTYTDITMINFGREVIILICCAAINFWVLQNIFHK